MRGSAEKGGQKMEMNGAETAEAEGLFSLIYYKILMKTHDVQGLNWVTNEV
jgi:hypothetical protein